MPDEYFTHLKHLLFNDAIVTHKLGMNNNSMDRICMYETFLCHVCSKDFQHWYNREQVKYMSNKTNFQATVVNEFVDDNGNVYPEPGGYWKSIEEVEEYALEHANKAIGMLMEKYYEDKNSCQSGKD